MPPSLSLCREGTRLDFSVGVQVTDAVGWVGWRVGPPQGPGTSSASLGSGAKCSGEATVPLTQAPRAPTSQVLRHQLSTVLFAVREAEAQRLSVPCPRSHSFGSGPSVSLQCSSGGVPFLCRMLGLSWRGTPPNHTSVQRHLLQPTPDLEGGRSR